MKNLRIKIKKQEDNGMKIIDKLDMSSRTSQLIHKNHVKNISYKESDSSKSNSKKKKSNFSYYIPKNKDEETLSKDENQKLHKKPNKNINLDGNSKDIFSNTLPNYNLNSNNKKFNKMKIFPRSKTNNEVINIQENSKVECESNRVYVHKKSKDFNILNINKSNLQSAKNSNKKGINYEDSYCQNHSSKDKYSKLVVFSNKNKYFKKKHLSEIENISNGIRGKMKHMKYLGSPIKKKKNSFFNISLNDSRDKIFNIEDDNLNPNENIINEKKFQDEIDNGYEYRLDNLKDYINIYSIYDSSSNENENENDFNSYEEENNTSSFEEDKLIIKNKNNNSKNKNKKIFINKNQINNIKNCREKSGDKGDTININKNIIINKKIILLPKEKDKDKNSWSKTSYGFFNNNKNVITNSLYSNYNNNKNKNKISKENKDNFSHCKTKPSLNNFIYQKKNFAFPNRRASSKEVDINKDNSNNNSKNKYIMEKINNKKSTEINKMSSTEQKFYENKKNNSYYKYNLLNPTFKKNLTERRTMSNIANISNISNKCCLTKIEEPEDIFYKISNINKSRKIIKVNLNHSKLKEKKDILNLLNRTTDLSLLEKVQFLEIKLKTILKKITKYQNCEKECYEFIHFYFEHYFYDDKIQIFYNTKNKKLIKDYTKMEIIYLFICYDILYSKNFNKACIVLKSIFSLLYENFILLLVLTIKNKINEEKEIINYLKKILDEYIEKNKKSNIININENKVCEIIGKNLNEIINYYKMLIDSLYKKYYNEKDYSNKFPDCLKNRDKETIDPTKIKNVISSFFFEVYKKASNYDFIEFKYFFYLFLSHKNGKMHIKLNSLIARKSKLDKNKERKIFKYPILSPIKENFKYTLILDLDETLIYLQNKESTETLILRPNIHEFLHEMKSIYELIIFSENSINYVGPILDIIQQKEKYFDHVLCQEYITLDKKGQEIKDLNLLGRDLKNLIVVDNMKQYYKNADNLICIKSFFGDANNDKKTLKLLGNFLKEIKLDSEKTGDIRISINNLKYKLYPKVINTVN